MTIQYPHKRPDLFWVVVGLVVLMGLLTSCSHDYYVNKYCPKVKDSTRVEIVKHDTTIFTLVTDTIPADTLKLLIKVPCADFEITKETKRQKVTIKVKDGVLTEEAICKEWEFKYFVSHTISTLTEKTFHSETHILKDKPKFKWHWLEFIIGASAVVIVWQRKRILGLVLRLFKPI